MHVGWGTKSIFDRASSRHNALEASGSGKRQLMRGAKHALRSTIAKAVRRASGTGRPCLERTSAFA
jgi:hypothetical protein